MLGQLCDAGCVSCPLHKDTPSVCISGRGAERGIRIVIVEDAPGLEEEAKSSLFVGPSGSILQDCLDKTLIDQSTVRFESIVRCAPKKPRGGSRPPEKDEIASCLPYLYRTLREIVAQGDTPVIVALGVAAMEMLTGQDKMRPSRGRSFRMIIHPMLRAEFADLDNKLFVIPTYAPAGVLRGNLGYAEHIVNDLNKAWRQANNDTISNVYWSNYQWVTDPDVFDAWADDALAKYARGEISMISYDTETSALDEMVYDPEQYVVCVSLCIEPTKAIVVPLKHCAFNAQDNDPIVWKRLIDTLRRLLTTIPICGWGLIFDVKWTKVKLDTLMINFAFDGLLASKWMWGSRRDEHGLDALTASELGFESHGEEVNKARMFDCPQQVLLRYAGGDADGSLILCQKSMAQMASVIDHKGKSALDYYREKSLRCLVAIPQMEMSGIKVSQSWHKFLMMDFPKQIAPLDEKVRQSSWGVQTATYLAEQRTHKKTGKPAPLEFNLKSPECTRYLLYTAMGLKADEKKMKKTGPSTDKDTLEDLRVYCADTGQLDKAEIIDAIRERNKLNHTLTTFIANIGKYSMYDGYFHTQYNIAGAETGRMSTYQPSLHGQPKGSKARWQFVSRWEGQGGLIVAGDGSQMEMKVLAMLSGDENLIETIQSGVDLHSANAEKMFNVKMADLPKAQQKELRKQAKTSGFGGVYGIGANKLAADLGISKREAQGILDSWDKTFPRTLEFKRKEWSLAKKHGYTYTHFGRIRHIENAAQSQWGDRAWRQINNTGIQSTASDIILSALLEVFDDFQRLGLKSQIFGFIHDAIVVDAAPGELFEVFRLLKYRMQTWTNEVLDWRKGVDITADFEIGAGWGFPLEVKDFDTERGTMTVQGPPLHVGFFSNEAKQLHLTEVSKHGDTELLTLEYAR